MRRALVAAAVLALAGSVTLTAIAQDEDTPSEPCPDFQAKDWIGSDGLTTFEDFKGQVLLLESWATT